MIIVYIIITYATFGITFSKLDIFKVYFEMLIHILCFQLNSKPKALNGMYML